MNCFYCNNSALASNHVYVSACRDTLILVSNSFPYVSVNLHTPEPISLDSLYNPTLSS